MQLEDISIHMKTRLELAGPEAAVEGTDLREQFWGAIGSLWHSGGSKSDWRLASGPAFPLCEPFLLPTPEVVASLPCPCAVTCDCRHEVRETNRGLVAACGCRLPDFCHYPLVPLQPEDIQVLRVNDGKLLAGLREALALGEPVSGRGDFNGGLYELGRLTEADTSVCVWLATEGGLSRLTTSLHKARARRPGPAVVLSTFRELPSEWLLQV